MEGSLDDKIMMLKGMFDNLPEETIKKVLKESDGNVDRSIDLLLNLPTLDATSPTPSARSDTSITTTNISTTSDANLSIEDSDALFAKRLMEEEERRLNGNQNHLSSTVPSNPVSVSANSRTTGTDKNAELSDEELARRLQQELNFESDADYRLARQLQNQQSRTYYTPPTHQYTPPTNDASHLLDFGNLDMNKLSEIIGEFKRNIQDEMIPLMTKELQKVELPEIDESIDAGKKVGSIAFKISGMKVESVEIPRDKVELKLEGQQIILKITDIKLVIEKFDWKYKKEKFPKLKDKGQAGCDISDVVVDVKLNWSISVVNGIKPSVSVTQCDVKIGSLGLKISGTVASVLYNIVIAAFKSLIKGQLETAMADMIRSAISEHASDLMEG